MTIQNFYKFYQKVVTTQQTFLSEREPHTSGIQPHIKVELFDDSDNNVANGEFVPIQSRWEQCLILCDLKFSDDFSSEGFVEPKCETIEQIVVNELDIAFDEPNHSESEHSDADSADFDGLDSKGNASDDDYSLSDSGMTV